MADKTPKTTADTVPPVNLLNPTGGTTDVNGVTVPLSATAEGAAGDSLGGAASTPGLVIPAATEKATGIPMLSPSLRSADFTESIANSPATPKGWGKGDKEPALTRLSDLVKIINTLATNGNEADLNQDALDQVYKQAGQARVATGVSGLIDKGAFVATHVGLDTSNAAAAGQYDAKQQAIREAVYEQAWKDMVKHADQVMGVPGTLRTAPAIQDAPKALQTLGSLPLSQSLRIELQRKGFTGAASEGYDLSDLVKDHDTFVRGAPGSPGVPATSTTMKTTGSDYYQQFMDGLGGKSSNNITNEMIATGNLVVPTSGKLTDADIGKAFQSVMSASLAQGVSPSTLLTTQLGSMGLPDANLTENQAYVEHAVQQIGGPGALTAQQENAIANGIAGAGGVSTASGEDWVIQQVTDAAANNINTAVTHGKAPTNYNGWALAASEAIRTQYENMGIAISPDQLAQQVSNVLNDSSVTSIYAAGDAGTDQGSQAARDQAEQLFPSLKSQLQAGVSLGGSGGLAAGYLSTAANLLGISTSDMPTSDPKWTAWADGPNGTQMTQQQWAQKIMTDPTYGFQSSQTSKNANASAANGLLTMMGALPSGGAPFGTTSSVATEV